MNSGSQPPIDLLFLDVFDGADDIPPAFTAPGTHCTMSSQLRMRMARPVVTTALEVVQGPTSSRT